MSNVTEAYQRWLATDGAFKAPEIRVMAAFEAGFRKGLDAGPYRAMVARYQRENAELKRQLGFEIFDRDDVDSGPLPIE